MQDLLSDPDFGRLATFSANTFLEFGFDVRPFAAMGDEPPDMLGAATADGFTDALVMPPTSWQDQHHVALASAFASHDGWDPPYVDVDGMSPVGRPPGAYVLLLHPDPRTDDDLRGLTAPALHKSLGSDHCLTVTEYLIVQRTLFERYGDHRFHDYSADPSGWMWLADSTDSMRTAMAYWNSTKQRVEVTACKTGSKNPRKGARRCRIVPLGDRRSRRTMFTDAP